MNKQQPDFQALKAEALSASQEFFARVDTIAEQNTEKVLQAFHKYRLTDYHFRTTTGYAYNDAGRETLDKIWAQICGAESALVRAHFVSGTHALATVLFGILRPGDELIALTGTPYDTMQTVIGHSVNTAGSLKEFGIAYQEIALTATGEIDLAAFAHQLSAKTKMVLIQRSRGYSMRKPFTLAAIETMCRKVKELKPDCICFVDNCYGEFVDTKEPTAVGADIMAGSMIKNPGGGIAPTGGYIAGKATLVEMAATRLTAPGIGSELGSSLADNRLFFQGIFLAPHVVAQAIKSAIFAAELFTRLGYHTNPAAKEERGDIIQAIELGSSEKMVDFCRALQRFSPVDAHVAPEPSPMPGYSNKIIMAGGTFVQGSSIELSADGPIRPPYAVYLQGSLSFEHSIVALLGAAKTIGANLAKR